MTEETKTPLELARRLDSIAGNLALSPDESEALMDAAEVLSASQARQRELEEALRDALAAAYEQGCLDVQANYRPDLDPEFGEAARDYAHSALVALLNSPAGEQPEGVRQTNVEPQCGAGPADQAEQLRSVSGAGGAE